MCDEIVPLVLSSKVSRSIKNKKKTLRSCDRLKETKATGFASSATGEEPACQRCGILGQILEQKMDPGGKPVTTLKSVA